MSNKTFNARNNKAKKGISPVIATVILVAVAVVIAAALAGFSSSLFGSYSSTGAAAQISEARVNSDGTGHVTVHNTGNTNDAILSAQVDAEPSGTMAADTVNSPPLTFTATPNGDAAADLSVLGSSFTQGDVVTLKVTMQSGTVLSHSVIVTAP